MFNDINFYWKRYTKFVLRIDLQKRVGSQNRMDILRLIVKLISSREIGFFRSLKNRKPEIRNKIFFVFDFFSI